MRRMQKGVGGQNNIFSFAKSKAKVVDSKKQKSYLRMLLDVKKQKQSFKRLLTF